MLVASEYFDVSEPVTIFARISDQLSEEERRAKYDLPLSNSLSRRCVEHLLRGYLLSATDALPAGGVGIEVRLQSSDSIGVVCEALVSLGVGPETAIELETDRAMVDFLLRDVS